MSNISSMHRHPSPIKQTLNTNNPGFTIVELLIVIVVIAILAAISIVSYNGIQTRARASATDADLSNLDTKLQAYYIVNNNTVPDSLEKLKQDGFGDMTSKMNWWDNNKDYTDYNTPRGKYFVYGNSDGDGSGSFWITYWDYKNERWTEKYWQWYRGKFRSYISTYRYGDCEAERLEQCSLMPQ